MQLECVLLLKKYKICSIIYFSTTAYNERYIQRIWYQNGQIVIPTMDRLRRNVLLSVLDSSDSLIQKQAKR